MDARTSILTRLYVVLTLLALLPAAVALQLVKIYVEEGKDLREVGVRQASSHIPIAAMRGAIYDRAGRTLAVNTARYEVALDPTRTGFDARADEFYALLSRLTGTPAATYRRTVAQRTSRQYVLLVRNLDEAKKEQLETLRIPGLILSPKFARRYTYGRIGAHVLGHVDTDLTGRSGIELQYDELLQGIEGRQGVQRDRRGVLRPVVDGRVVAPVHGQGHILTIDLVLQSILQEELLRGVNEAGARWGTAIAMDPHSGGILAMANAPDYDPNRPGAFPEASRRNHGITDQIEPGSTFKLVTAVAAIEEGVVSPSDSIDTGRGYRVFGGRAMRDTRAHGVISFADAIQVSSNIAFAEVGQRLEPATLYQYARAMGFGQPTLIDLPGEESGRLHRPDQWSGTTRTSMSIGYAVTATPLQLLTAYAALANGGLLVRPHVLAERRDMVTGRTLWRVPQDSIRRAFTQATADTLRPLFERVVSTDGTARRAMVDGLPIAGKTGTARIAEGGQYINAYRATFVGMFPVDRPEVVMIVVLDRPTNGYFGGTVAAPIFAGIAERWAAVQPALGGRRSSEPRGLRAAAPVPAVAGLPESIATRRLRAAGLDGTVSRRATDAWRPVATQHPTAGDSIEPHRLVRLTTTNGAPITDTSMPDLRGLSTREAAAWMARLGVSFRTAGIGTVVEQAPAPGESLPSLAILTSR